MLDSFMSTMSNLYCALEVNAHASVKAGTVNEVACDGKLWLVARRAQLT